MEPHPLPAAAILQGAMARLEARWGSAAIRLGEGAFAGRLTDGATALAPLPAEPGSPGSAPSVQLAGEVISTGFAALDAILGSGGLPRQLTAVFRGAGTSGKTTLALRAIAEAQAQGAIAAWLDGSRSLDPLEAVARGVDLRWLIVLRPHDPTEGFWLAGALLTGRAVDLLVVDLPPRLGSAHEPLLRRLAAHARRLGVRLILLAPPDAGVLQGALAEVSSLRLELERRAWIRLGRDIVGQHTAVTVAKDRFGAPGRRAELEIRYLADGEQTADLARLLDHGPPAAPLTLMPPSSRSRITTHAPPASRLAAPAAAARSRPEPPARGPGRPGWTTLGAAPRPGRQPRRHPAGRAARAAAGHGP
jgi:RecA/RadA recombinase